jgi:Tol biopolymer transport system component
MQLKKKLNISITAIVLVAFAGALIGVRVYGCEKQEPLSEDVPTESVAPAKEYTPPTKPIVQEPLKAGASPSEPISLEDELYRRTKIAFVSTRKEDAPPGTPLFMQESYSEFYIMNTDGSHQKRITSNRLHSRVHPLWSPDGSWMAFWLNSPGKQGLYVVNADGSEQKRLTDNPKGDRDPCWSPDGKKIAFVSRGRNSGIHVMNADGSEQKNVTPTVRSDSPPRWSPDGKKIAFVSVARVSGRTNVDIYVMNADGSEQKRLTDTPALDSHPSWSPDGEKIAFRSLYLDGSGNQEVSVMNADGSGKKKLITNGKMGLMDLDWSPNGNKIAFVLATDGGSDARNFNGQNYDIYVINADGSEQKRLTNSPGWDWDLSWSPDGEKIAFLSERDGNKEIYIMNPDGSEQKNLTNNPAPDFRPSWSPFLTHED